MYEYSGLFTKSTADIERKPLAADKASQTEGDNDQKESRGLNYFKIIWPMFYIVITHKIVNSCYN